MEKKMEKKRRLEMSGDILEKINKLFDTFDANKDRYLSLTELVAWITAVDSNLNNNIRRIPNILLEYMTSHHEIFIHGAKGLSTAGFRRIYEERERDLDLDLENLDQFRPQKNYIPKFETCPVREEKMKKIFDKFDANKDGHLSMMELMEWVMAVEPKLHGEPLKILAMLSDHLRSSNFSILIGYKGLCYTGFRLIYQQKERDIDWDFHNFQYKPETTHAIQQNTPSLQKAAVKAAEGLKPKGVYKGPDPELAATLEKEILDTNPGVRWDDVAGQHEAKKLLQEAVVLPLCMPKYFQGIRRPWRGVLMVGPPGTGKTLLAKAVATECGTTFLSVTCSSLCAKWYGESERLVRCLFDLARAWAPSTIFIDEIDSLCNTRGASGEHEVSRRLKSELLVQIDGLNNSTNNTAGKSVTVLAATNFPWGLDEAIRRRLEKRIYVQLPDFNSRKELIKINLKSVVIAPDLDIDQMAQRTEGYSGDNLTNICRDASLNGVRCRISGKNPDEIKNMSEAEILEIPVTMDDFLQALNKIQPTVSAGDIQRHRNWFSDFGST